MIVSRKARNSHCLVPAILLLDTNQLTGTIPTTLGNLALASMIHLELNQLQGSVPQEICRLTETGVLTELVVSCADLSPGPACDCCKDCLEGSWICLSSSTEIRDLFWHEYLSRYQMRVYVDVFDGNHNSRVLTLVWCNPWRYLNILIKCSRTVGAQRLDTTHYILCR